MAAPTSRTSTARMACRCLQGTLADADPAAAADSAGPVAAAIGVQADGGGAVAAVAADGVRVDRAAALRAAAETARLECEVEG